MSLSELKNEMTLPFLAWKKDVQSVYLDCNHALAQAFGFTTYEAVLGITDDKIYCPAAKSAAIFRMQDKTVMHSGQTLKILELNYFSDGQLKAFLAKKEPLLDLHQKIIGTYGQAIDVTPLLHQIDYFLPFINQMPTRLEGGSYLLSHEHTGIKLTARQLECLFFLLRGKTIKQIGQALQRSYRTVEIHVEKLKLKFSCQSKSELIDKAYSLGFATIIPEHLFFPYPLI